MRVPVIRTSDGIPRWCESLAAALMLLLLSPLLILAAVAVRLTSAGPVLFRHRRVGWKGQSFDILKLRTMRHAAAGSQITRSGDVRVTAVGRILRRTKLDELPTLWNVVRGDMSLVGPRPEAARYVDLTDPRWVEVLQARPGITDPVTLKLRNEEELLASAADHESFYRQHLLPYKLQGYCGYLRQRTWMTDVAVLTRTLAAVVRPSLAPVPLPSEIVSRTGGPLES
jgi:lipopolysaccharide/colanic/teichoic acid biosynthesis glycosyltransferase